MISIISIRAQAVMRATVWAFIYVIEHTKTKGGDVKSMHLKWDVSKWVVHRFRDRLSVFFYWYQNVQISEN